MQYVQLIGKPIEITINSIPIVREFFWVLLIVIGGGIVDNLYTIGYQIVYQIFLQDKKLSSICYCLTNKRALVYNEKKDELEYGYIINYKVINIFDYKNGYGDVVMCVPSESNNKHISIRALVTELIEHVIKKFKEHPENKYSIQFESIQNPNQVANIIHEARMKLEND